ncbi:flagellar hook-basal body complex protein FliE [Neiella marina]|uniref:Flagellar hook-basal body complex protein FliE n=1 Tax=Neiella marina TaxID=508461 RepID=A0A8J2U5C7_9GAMM|nr:flagellar hook-basal body complex protein FliE [Neiella marina]GGA78052.1 flagellar hook-basal body complex protein FliE [Neiella marina]
MKVMANDVFQQMQGMKLEANSNIVERTAIAPSNNSSVDFGNLLRQAIDNVNELQADSKAKATAFEMGDRSVSLGDVMIASQKSGVAFDATVQVRNKLMEAYKEIMSMPV